MIPLTVIFTSDQALHWSTTQTRWQITMVPPMAPDPAKWLEGMPSQVVSVTCNGGGLYSMQINCHSCGKTHQLKQRMNKTLATEDQVIAAMRVKALDEHASCVRYDSPPRSAQGTKRAVPPTSASDSVRSPPRTASAVLSSSGGVTKVESLERRLEYERAHSASAATEASEAHARELADVRAKNNRIYAMQDKLVGYKMKQLTELREVHSTLREAHATLITQHAKLVPLHDAMSLQLKSLTDAASAWRR